MYAKAVAGTRYQFADLRTLLAKASPLRSGDVLAGLAAGDGTESGAALLG
jgi:ethanolamine ammonia-lyase large subunit